MALTGQLSDMSLAELIEFFCNQRKTGRLKIDYPRGHSVFFIKDGDLVDAKVGALSGVEAVYFSLTLPNAAFDFSPDVEATRRTINERWTQVVLEGLRRLDEGLSPTEADAFGSWSPTETDLAVMLDQVEHLEAVKPRKAAALLGTSRVPGAVFSAPGSAKALRSNAIELWQAWDTSTLRIVSKTQPTGLPEGRRLTTAFGLGGPHRKTQKIIRALLTGYLLYALSGDKTYRDFADPDVQLPRTLPIGEEAAALTPEEKFVALLKG